MLAASSRMTALPSAGTAGPASFEVADRSLYHSDLGHHSDFYQAGDPLTVREAAALVGDDEGVLLALQDSEPVRHEMEPDNLGLLYHLGAVSHLRQGREAAAREP